MSDKIKKEFGIRIKNIRKARGLTQEKLAENTGITLSYIAMIEGGKRNPTLDFIMRIAKGLDIEVQQLFSLDEIKGIKIIKKTKCFTYDITILAKIKEMINVLEKSNDCG